MHTYQELDEVGIAQFVNGFAKDLPRVDVVGRETSSPIRPIGASYGYTTANIRQARLTGRSLPSPRQRRRCAPSKPRST